MLYGQKVHVYIKKIHINLIIKSDNIVIDIKIFVLCT